MARGKRASNGNYRNSNSDDYPYSACPLPETAQRLTDEGLIPETCFRAGLNQKVKIMGSHLRVGPDDEDDLDVLDVLDDDIDDLDDEFDDWPDDDEG